MWRVSFTLLILLTSIIGGMLFWQWHAYSESIEPLAEELQETAEQYITVESKGNTLSITQLFLGLKKEKEYRIILPDTIGDWTCNKEDGNPCESFDDNPSSFVSDDGSLRIKYRIEFDNNKSSFLLNEWLGKLPDVNVTNTSIEIIDKARRQGTWVTGFPLKGSKKLELIDYYVFKGKGESGSLYWQPTPFSRIKGEQSLEYYINSGENKKSPFGALGSLKTIHNFPGLSVVFTDDFSETNGIGLMIVNPSIKEEVFERKVIYHYFLGKASNLPLEERWLIDVLTSLVIKQDSKMPKGNEFIQELRKNLSEDEILQFMSLVISEKVLTPEKLDELLGSLSDRKTRYFSLNKNEETKLIPLYFYDDRKVLVKDKLNEEIELLLVNNEKLYPFVETISALGFEIKVLSDEETLLLNKGNNSYRFYVNQNIFIYNEEDYGLLENPLKTINGKIYMESSWLESLFKVVIEENSDEVKLSVSF